MTRARLAAVGLAVAAAGVVSACGGSSSSSNGNKTAFCKDNADLAALTVNITTPDQLVPIFKANRAKLDDLQKNAPSEVKTDTDLLVTTAKKGADSGDASGFSDPKLQAAGQHVDSFCGQSTTTTSGATSTDYTSSTLSTSDSTSSSSESSTSESSTSAST